MDAVDALTTAQNSLRAAEKVRVESDEVNPLVEYHLRRAEILARIGQGLATLRGAR